MKTPQDVTKPTANLRILLLEDSEIDANLVERDLKRHGLDFSLLRVETKNELLDALATFHPEIILSDLAMPAMNGVEALELTLKQAPDLPFIFVSGMIGEDQAIDLLKQGATDFVLKQNLSRLASSVERALKEAEGHREWKRAQEQLRKLSAAVEQGALATVITDVNGLIEYVNPKFEKVSGYTSAEAIGKTPRILKSGETAPEVYEKLWKTILSGQVWSGELHNRRKNGELFWEASSISPIFDESGKITHFVGVKEDITQRRSLEEQLRRTQRLEGIGLLASGVAHDLNNILAPILMSIPLLEMALAKTEYASLISTLRQSAERGADIVKQVLTFARGVEGQRVLVQVQHLIREILKIVSETFPRSITIRGGAPKDLRPVIGDATQIHQVLLNLCINARDAMPQGGILTITAENRLVDESYAATCPEAIPGSYVMITVADTGEGMAPCVLEKIFDPFFTTKAIGKGTGLGLSTALGIVKSHHGFLTVESELGKGAKFTIFLPTTLEGAEAPAPPDSAIPRGNGELILLVDDEESLLKIQQVALKMYGYRVLTATDGAEAVAVFAQNAAEIALVLTDIAMPLMDGIAMTRALRRLKPGVRIIISTGHGARSDVSSLQVNAFLYKPYDTATLLRTLHEVLAAGKTAPRNPSEL